MESFIFEECVFHKSPTTLLPVGRGGGGPGCLYIWMKRGWETVVVDISSRQSERTIFIFPHYLVVRSVVCAPPHTLDNFSVTRMKSLGVVRWWLFSMRLSDRYLRTTDDDNIVYYYYCSFNIQFGTRCRMFRLITFYIFYNNNYVKSSFVK